jgi:protein-L-isoaspartate(D-aspartate) O-methyltransferase
MSREEARDRMVREQIEARGVSDVRVLQAMRAVPRHAFVPVAFQAEAYGDHPLPIGHGQTISQPYIVAFMAEALHLRGSERVLEVGSGSGYMAAVLAQLCQEVIAVELEPALFGLSHRALKSLGISNVEVRCSDGSLGCPERAPFDAILVSCAAAHLCPAWEAQLAPKGRLVFPLGSSEGIQQLVRVQRKQGSLVLSHLLDVRFVPLRTPET